MSAVLDIPTDHPARLLLTRARVENDLVALLTQRGGHYLGYVLPRASDGCPEAIPCGICDMDGTLLAAARTRARSVRVACPACKGTGRLDIHFADFRSAYDDVSLGELGHIVPLDAAQPPFMQHAITTVLTLAAARRRAGK